MRSPELSAAWAATSTGTMIAADLPVSPLADRLLTRAQSRLQDDLRAYTESKARIDHGDEGPHSPQRLLPREVSMAKLAATELAKRCALEGMQAMGANGYASEYRMEGYLRAALASTVFGGTSEIQHNIIAGTLGLG